MNLKHYAWLFKGALSPSVCDRIINTALHPTPTAKVREKEQGQIHRYTLGTKGEYRDLKKRPLSEDQKKDLLKKRNCEIVWVDEKWIYDLLHPYIKDANKNAGWNFEWDWTETSQFVIYDKDQFYGWHTDSSPKLGSDPTHSATYGKTRKLSSNILLSDPSDYEGGEFQIDSRMENRDAGIRPDIWTSPRERGTIIVFPSWVHHQATPVTKGVRHTMTHWHWGNPWK